MLRTWGRLLYTSVLTENKLRQNIFRFSFIFIFIHGAIKALVGMYLFIFFCVYECGKEIILNEFAGKVEREEVQNVILVCSYFKDALIPFIQHHYQLKYEQLYYPIL